MNYYRVISLASFLAVASLAAQTPFNLESSDWFSKISQNIAAGEYNISTTPLNALEWQSPNRAQNLRAFYTANTLTLKRRYDSLPADQWRINMEVLGVFRGEELIYATIGPSQAKVDKERINFQNENFGVEYINQENGIRQNFIIKKRPQGTGGLQIRIAVKSELNIENGNNEILFTQNGETELTYSDLKCWDSNGMVLPSYMCFEKGQIRLIVNDSGAVYPVFIDPINKSSSKTIESNQVSAALGYFASTAGDINGDGYSDILVGSPFYDNGQTDEGVAFVFFGSSNGIIEPASDTLEINQSNARFGSTLSTIGDYNKDGFSDIIVGAPYYSNGQSKEGGAFVFSGSKTGIIKNPVFTLESNQTGAQAGSSVSAAGDINNDGFIDILVGAQYFDFILQDEGSVFVYYGSKNGFSNSPNDTLHLNVILANFGKFISGGGDYNSDNFSDIIVGGPNYNLGKAGEGAFFIYYGKSTGLKNCVPDTFRGDRADAGLGYTVANIGDFNGDGFSDLCAGGYGYRGGEGGILLYFGSKTGVNRNARDTFFGNFGGGHLGESISAGGDINGDGYGDFIAGSEYFALVFYGSPDVVLPPDTLKSPGGQFIGQCVSTAGDINGDGYSDVLVGAKNYSNGQSSEGAAFLYLGSPSGISKTPCDSLLISQKDAQMGYSVASAGDLNGDGLKDVIVGAPFYDNGQTDEGAAFVYLGAPTGLSTIPLVTLEGNQTDAHFGSAVATAGDVNGDGYADVLIGAPLYDKGQTDEGAVFVYSGTKTGLNSAFTLLETNQAGAQFGSSVATAGDYNGDGYSDIIIGAPNFTNGQSKEGLVFLYKGSAGGINTNADTLEYNQAAANAGTSVATAGDVNGDGYSDVIVGAPYFSLGQSQEGVAFVHYGSKSGILKKIADTLQVNQATASFGFSVASASDINADGFDDVIVGAPSYDSGFSNEGAAFVFKGGLKGLKIASDTLSGKQNNAAFGYSVASSGDINADGYSDIVIGAPTYANGQSAEGAIYSFMGSANGLVRTPNAIIESNQANANFGVSVASAGDVNGDGYPDVIAGANLWDSSYTNQGTAFLFYGNSSKGLRNNIRLYGNSKQSILDSGNFQQRGMGAGMYSKSPMGNVKGKVAWELAGNGQSFSMAGGNITNSVAYSGISKSYISLTDSGKNLVDSIVKAPKSRTRLRMRQRFDPVTAIDGRMYGPWKYSDPVIWICEATFANITVAMCNSYKTPSKKRTYTNSGKYFDTLTNKKGCDSIITINLTINKLSYDTISKLACMEYRSPSGKYLWKTNGNYRDTIKTIVGCDSFLYIKLKILLNSVSDIFVSACEKYTSPSGRHIYTSTATYEDTLVNYLGCDSLVQVHATIYKNTTKTISPTACISYLSPSKTKIWTQSGSYSDTIPTYLGCDSIITIKLTINQNSSATLIADVCNAYTGPSGKKTWTTSGIFTDTIPNYKGCDSVITVKLNIRKTSFANLSKTACNGYRLPGGKYLRTATGMYKDTMPNQAGCDSIVTLNLTINKIDTGVNYHFAELVSKANAVNYQWLDCGNNFSKVMGETKQAFAPKNNGVFAVEVANGICTDTSACYPIINAGLSHTSQAGIRIIPNPTKAGSPLQIESNHLGIYTIYDMQGRKIQEGNLLNGTTPLTIGQAGVYLVVIEIDSGKFGERIVVW